MLYAPLLLLMLTEPLLLYLDLQVGQVQHNMTPPQLTKLVENSDNGAMLEQVLAHILWNKQRGALGDSVEATSQSQVTSISWSLKGIGHQQLHAPAAVISDGSNVKIYHEGDILPDGALLIRVMPHEIEIEKDGEERNVYLFKNE